MQLKSWLRHSDVATCHPLKSPLGGGFNRSTKAELVPNPLLTSALKRQADILNNLSPILGCVFSFPSPSGYPSVATSM